MTTLNLNRQLLRATVLVASALVLAGCPATPEADPIEPGPRITSFTASEALVARGATVTLSWQTEETTSVKLENPKSGQSVEGATDPSGSAQVVVNEDTLFVLTALNDRGASERRALSVRVRSSAHDLMLYALPTEITSGEDATLTWSAPDAQAVTITASPGGAVNLNGQLASGTLTVNPATTTQYTLDADGKTAKATITVRPRIATLAATPTSAPRGGTVTIAWQTAGAVEVSLNGSGRGVLVTETDPAKVASGTYAETIPATVDTAAVYSYTLTAKDASGATTTRDLTVYVSGVPVVKTFSAPKFVRAGEQFTLSWTTAEADVVTLSTGGAVFYESPGAAAAASGSLSLGAPGMKTTYTLTARNTRGGSDTDTVEVEPLGAPSVTTFTANPTSANAGAAITLSWNAPNARRVRITEATDGVVYDAEAATDTGTFVVYPNHSATYTLTADNTFNETATANTTVTINNPVVLTPSLTGTLARGSTVQLTWNLASATQIFGLPHIQIVTRSPSTAFDDISTTGAKLTLTSTDDATALLPIAFRVPVMGRVLGDEIRVNTNGYVTFGPHQNKSNYSPVALPTAKIEPFSIAPYWADLLVDSSAADSGLYWQVKTVNGVRVLIIQWHKMTYSSADVTFQAKIYESGQIDFEYETVASTSTTPKSGVQGPDARLALPTPLGTTGTGLTLFGPLTSPANFTVAAPMTVTGSLAVGSSYLRVSHTFSSVVDETELAITEVMARPHPSIATTGEWIELSNTTGSAIDLTSWQLLISDGGSFALSGSIPPYSSIVAGQSSDPALNGDAGVTLVLAGLDLNDTAESARLSRVGTLPATGWTTSFDGGTARVFDLGPIKVGTATPNSLTCAATQLFSSAPVQLGTPGRQSTCGFGYALQSVNESFFDISATGTFIDIDADDELTTPVTLPATGPAPLFFGTPRPIVSLGANGFMAFSSLTTTGTTNKSSPSTTAPVGTAAIFWDDLEAVPGLTPRGGIYYKRVGASEDTRNPAAHWIFQWTSMSHFVGDDRMSFQIKIFDDGVIEYHYREMYSSSVSAYGSGLSSTVWLENPAGTQALPVAINQAVISPNSAYRFTPR